MCKLVSIIIPVYNVFDYLGYCVESLKRQTYKHLEIILIDDGSTDGSGDLCDMLQKSDSRIIVYHKENGGVSSARNYGIEKATGFYQMFVDGDDWLDLNGVELLVNDIEKTNADICFCNKYFKNESDIQIATSLSESHSFPAMEIAYRHLHYGFVVSPCLALANRDMVKSMKFREDIHTLEDWEYNFRILAKVQTVSILDVAYYHYRSVLGSASKSPLNNRKLSCFKIVEAVKQMVRNEDLPFKKEIDCVPAFLIYHMLVAYANNGEIENAGKQLKRYARYFFVVIISSSQIDVKYKLYTILACFSLNLFRILYHIKNK